MDAPARAAWVDLWRREAGRPLGDVTLSSNLINAEVSGGLQQAACNLMAKALRAATAGDDARARAYVERAVQLPFDQHEEVAPSWQAASGLIFDLVTDALEGCAESDASWLDAAIIVLDRADTQAAIALRATLAAIPQSYELTPGETRRLAAAAGDTHPDAWYDDEPTDHTEQVDAILAVLHAAVAYTSQLAINCSDRK